MTTSNATPKIFGIGLNKTGTTTLGQMGKALGLRCSSCDGRLLQDVVLRNDFTRIQKKVDKYDLFEDWPWPLIYKELDTLYPGSKFILTVRKSEDAWFKSLVSHSMRTHPRKNCRKLAYGHSFPEKNEQFHLGFYRKHNDSVRTYFENRNCDFLELCWENGDGFDELCGFLNVEAPDLATPHANSKANAKVRKKRWVANKVLSFLNY